MSRVVPKSSTTDGDTNNGLTVAVDRSVSHSDLADGVTDDITVLDSDALEKVGEGDLDKDGGKRERHQKQAKHRWL